MNDWSLQELSVQPDHVHLLVQIPPRVSVSKAVNVLKGGSSRIIRQGREMPPRHFLEFGELEEFLWGKSFWCYGMLAFRCDGFFAESVGRLEEAVIKRYIQNQGKQIG